MKSQQPLRYQPNYMSNDESATVVQISMKSQQPLRYQPNYMSNDESATVVQISI